MFAFTNIIKSLKKKIGLNCQILQKKGQNSSNKNYKQIAKVENNVQSQIIQKQRGQLIKLRRLTFKSCMLVKSSSKYSV